jgi:DNA helicase II / ATP-dependent DNA helicase PcrA
VAARRKPARAAPGHSWETQLNDPQLVAVRGIEGPSLILAGAGSGKTRVITHRIAHMLASGVPQKSILAVTFTNKAAREMGERLHQMTGKKLRDLTVSTFHAFGVKVLREHGELLGYRPRFTIYDESDQIALVKEVARVCGVSPDNLDLWQTRQDISSVKSRRESLGKRDARFKKLFREYESHLKLYNAVDFDDLIALPVGLLEEHPEIRKDYGERYRYVLVDEFQDTSSLQYALLRLLAKEHRNLCVVGDDDQSIYSWRGASYENIRSFEKDFPGCLEVKLEQNYRSTETILKAANSVISRNTDRKPKALWSANGTGEPILFASPEDESAEAELIATTIRSLVSPGGIGFQDVAVLIRANSLTRPIEEAFVKDRIPYEVTGGMSFFERKEVRDILAWLKVTANAEDDVNYIRAVNAPRRGVGKRTLEVVVDTAGRLGCSLYSAAAAQIAAADSPLAEREKDALREFHETVEEFRPRLLAGKRMADALRELVDRIEYWAYLVTENKEGDTAKWKYQNVGQLANGLADYAEHPDTLDPTLHEYLHRVSLQNRDEQEEDTRGRVQLMTMHAAKGLEFDTVFIAAAEEGILPHTRSLEENQDNIAEERRLFYVALTRARRKLYITAARTRRKQGVRRDVVPSPFLDEIPEELIEYLEPEEELAAGEASALLAAMPWKKDEGKTEAPKAP